MNFFFFCNDDINLRRKGKFFFNIFKSFKRFPNLINVFGYCWDLSPGLRWLYRCWPGFLSSRISLFAWKVWVKAGWEAGPVVSPRCEAPGPAPYHAQLAACPLNILSLSYTLSGVTWWWEPCSFVEAMFRRTRLIEETCKTLSDLDWVRLETYTWDIVSVTDSLREEPIPDLPGEDAGTFSLVLRDLPHHAGGRHPRLRPADGPGLDRAGLVVSEYCEDVFCLILSTLSYLPSILETQPLETWSILEISHGRAPWWASSTIFCLVESGRGRPLT